MKKLVPSCLALLVFAALPTAARAQGAGVVRKAEVGRAAKHDVSKPLRDITPLAPGKRNKVENPMNFEGKPTAEQIDPVVQRSSSPNVPASPDPPVARLHTATDRPTSSHRLMRSASHPNSGAATM